MQKMKGIMLNPFLYALLGLLLTIEVAMIQAQDQSGFISIDCGSPTNSSYTEKTTGINYISDSKFIQTGESKSIMAAYKSQYQQQLAYLRSFPQGKRNCYTINVTSWTKYIIRATFLYGNYDGNNEIPEFDLYVGNDLWETVKIKNVSLDVDYEIIHVPSLDYVYVCLVNTGSGTPFVSALELRTLNNDSYVTQFGSLSRFMRFDLGSITNKTYRYKDDISDRYWAPISFSDWTQLSTTLTDNSFTPNNFSVPAVVLSTAATPVNDTASFDFYWDSDTTNDQYYVYLHFNEVELLAQNDTRSFDVFLNGKNWYGPLSPGYQMPNTLYTSSALSGEKRYLFSLSRTESSTLPPILNALEVYTLRDFSQSYTHQDDVDAITNIKRTYGVKRNWQGDPCGPVEFMWEGLNCSVDSDNIPRIISLDLSSSGLTGEIPSSISKLAMLQHLDLSNNSLSGTVPDFLTKLQSLQVLNLENNNFTGSVPSELVDKSKKGSLSLSVGENPNLLCGSASCNSVAVKEEKKKTNIVIPIVASVAGFLVLVVIIVVVIFCFCRPRTGQPTATVSMSNIKVEPTSSPSITPNVSLLEAKQRQYSYTDLVKMTNNFERVLGKGGFGTVYHGFIDDGTQVAVKMLSQTSAQGYQQFVAEASGVKLLLRVHHRNLTSLIGYCNEENNTGLMYEYMANGNLYEHLSGKDSTAKFLTWQDRLRIAVDSAQGLEYLHNGCRPPIVHRDVKSTNILLNENFQAKLADFGLSKSFPTDGGTHLSTVVCGTPGYLDPEYYISNRLTEKSDVYSFGVVILEIITGQPAITRAQGQENTNIIQWVKSRLSQGDVKNIADSRIQSNFEISSVWKAVEIAMACVSPNPTKRPNMSEVVKELKDCLAIEIAQSQDAENNPSVELLTMNFTTELNPRARFAYIYIVPSACFFLLDLF
ncbi:LRR receptor-like serine/threonine-protein kinase IOS1 [Senna tora]|uniref:non-specific serine/threonine protein kinase n=1 Tax=Senna tora TaxID=362788 RepID=A0A835CJD3_9FABA|nr:LRR receptor-like serine/threonine-protein kinase IOS1 [Senna tora]